MKKDKKFLEELESFLGKSKHKDEIIAKYASIIKTEKDNGKRIKFILKELGSPEEIANKELSFYKNNKSNIFSVIKEKLLSLKPKKKENKEVKEKQNIKKKQNDKKESKPKKEKKNVFKSLKDKFTSFKAKKDNKKDNVVNKEKKNNIFKSLKDKYAAFKNKRKEKKLAKKERKKEKKKEEKKDKNSKSSKFKAFLTKDLFHKKERKVTDTPKEVVEEIKEEVEDKISDVSEIVSETHVFESRKTRIKRVIFKTLGVIFTCILVFVWLWVSVVFFASIFAYLDGIKFKGVIILAFSVDLLILWIVIMVNRAIFRKKMSLILNLIIIFISVGGIAFGGVMAFNEIKKIEYVQDVSDKYTMTRKLETYELPKESGEKFVITFNSLYNTQYIIKYDKNVRGKVKIDTRYYECYYDYYTKRNTDGVYVSLKLDDRDRFSVYLDDIKEGKIYDNDELARYTVKITINPDEAKKLVIQ